MSNFQWLWLVQWWISRQFRWAILHSQWFFLLAASRPSVCLHEDDVFSFVAKLMIHFEAFMYLDSGKHKTRISLLLHHCHENITPSHLCVQGRYQPHPAIHEHFSTKEQILSTPSLQFFSLPQVSHPYSNSHANVHAVSILVSKTSRHMFFPINALSLATNHI